MVGEDTIYNTEERDDEYPDELPVIYLDDFGDFVIDNDNSDEDDGEIDDD